MLINLFISVYQMTLLLFSIFSYYNFNAMYIVLSLRKSIVLNHVFDNALELESISVKNLYSNHELPQVFPEFILTEEKSCNLFRKKQIGFHKRQYIYFLIAMKKLASFQLRSNSREICAFLRNMGSPAPFFPRCSFRRFSPLNIIIFLKPIFHSVNRHEFQTKAN